MNPTKRTVRLAVAALFAAGLAAVVYGMLHERECLPVSYTDVPDGYCVVGFSDE